MTEKFVSTKIGLLIGFFSISIAISIAFMNCPAYYDFLPLVPLTFGLLNIFFGMLYRRQNLNSIIVILFNGIMFLRAVVMPYVLAVSGFFSSKRVNIESNMPKAIFLFIYEMIAEYFVLFFFTLKEYVQEDKTTDPGAKAKLNLEFSNYFFVVLLLVVGLGVCYVLAPVAVEFYRPIFGIEDYDFTSFDSRDLISEYATGFVAKFGLVTFRYFANVIRLVIPAIVLIFLKKKNVSVGYVRVITIILIFVFDLLLVDDTIATSLINALITLIFYNRLFSKQGKIVLYLSVAMLSVIAYFAVRISLTSGVGSSNNSKYVILRFSNYLQAYFCGTNNIAGGFNMNVPDFWDKMKYMVYEFLKGIPYANTIFHLDSTNISQLYNSVNLSSGQIVPAISSCYLYFTSAFVPAYGILFLIISYGSSKNIRKGSNPLSILGSIAICIYALMGTSMYSVEATWAFIFTIGLPIKLFSVIFERKEFLREAEK